MKPGEVRSTWKERGTRRALASWGLAVLCLTPLGCAHERAGVRPNIGAGGTSGSNRSVVDHYQVGCPDVLTIDVAGRTDVSTQQAVGPDGRIDLGNYGNLRVEGRTPVQIAAQVAQEIGWSPREVQVRVVEYRSQQVYLFGQAVGWQRAAPYVGQETVLDLLQRAQAITPGAEPNDVYVVRSHVGAGGRPEVFHVKLHDILHKNDDHTNLRLMPNDQVHIGETRQARVERCIPPILRPLYRALGHTHPPR